MSRYIRIPLFLLLATVLFGVATSAEAQDIRTLSIREGQVYLDGEVVPSDELPASLEAGDLYVNFSFTGATVFELDGAFYKIEGDRLVEAETNQWKDKKGNVSVFFREDHTSDPVFRVWSTDDPDEAGFTFKGEGARGVAAETYTRQLYDRANELHRLSEQVEAERGTGVNSLAREMRFQAEEAAKVAGVLPQIEMQNYLYEVQLRDNALFEQLLREQQMEAETHQLSVQIRSMEAGDERDALIETLNNKLNEIFDLKQENRRNEVEQLEGRLEELKSRVQEREDMRTEIIEKRLKELIGAYNPYNW